MRYRSTCVCYLFYYDNKYFIFIYLGENQEQTHMHDLSQIKKRKAQNTITDFVIKTTSSQQAQIDQSIAEFFYAANLPFNAAQLKSFDKMIQSLRPGYKPPSSKMIGGQLLDITYEKNEIDLKEKLQSKSLILTIDGWSNVRNDPILAISLHTGIESFLFNAYDSGSEKKTAKKCSEIVEAAIKQCEEKYDAKIFAVVTDNENKMCKMWQILKEKQPKLIAYGCSAHLLNLVEKDVTPQTILHKIIKIQRYFRNVHQAHGWLKEKDGLMPQIPNETRWNSYPECVRTFVANYHKYREIALEQDNEFNDSISNILNDMAIYSESVYLEKQLSIVASALNILQRESTSISEAVDVWSKLLKEEVLKSYKNFFQKRFNQAITPVHLLAHMMDPKYNREHLSSEQEDIAEEWISNNYPEYLPGIMAFKIKDDEFFPKTMLQENVINGFSSSKWWKIMEKKTEKSTKLPRGFCDFFSNLLSCPASSASIERFFSTFGLVWSKLRNRLGIEKAMKLVKVYRFLRSNEDENVDIDCDLIRM